MKMYSVHPAALRLKPRTQKRQEAAFLIEPHHIGNIGRGCPYLRLVNKISLITTTSEPKNAAS